MNSAIVNLLTLSDGDKSFIREQLTEEKCKPIDIERFIRTCEKSGLDPLSRQIYGRVQFSKVKKGGAEVWVPNLVIITSIDGFRSMAERTGEYLGQTPPEWLWCDQPTGEGPAWHDWCAPQHKPGGLIQNLPEAARIGVYRTGFPHPVYGYAAFESFAAYCKSEGEGQKKERRLNQFWAKMPEHQIAKCAEAQAFRKAFPLVYGGVYIEDEIRDEDDAQPEATEDERPQDPEKPSVTVYSAPTTTAPKESAPAAPAAPAETQKTPAKPKSRKIAQAEPPKSEPQAEEQSPFGDDKPAPTSEKAKEAEKAKTEDIGKAEDQDWFMHEIKCLPHVRWKGRVIGDLTLDEIEMIIEGWVEGKKELIATDSIKQKEAALFTAAHNFRKAEQK